MSAPWMPLYIADYLADTTQLTTAEHGAYLLLIMTYWRQGGLPDDDAMLARITRMTPKEWTRAKPVLAAFFQAGWKHSRIEKELEKSARKSEARAESGSRGGTAKALKNNDVTIANATILPQQKTDFALASSSLSQSDKIEKERNARDALSIGFEYFWNEWPNKVGKPAAQKSYARAFKEFGADVIYHGMRRYVADKPPDRPWLNPSTFLNQERFNDRPAVVQARASPESDGRSLLASLAMGNLPNEPDQQSNIIELNARPSGRSDGPASDRVPQSFDAGASWGAFNLRPPDPERR